MEISQPTTDQQISSITWRALIILVSLNMPYLLLFLGPFFFYGIPWRMSATDPKDFWPYSSETLGSFILWLAELFGFITPILLPLAAIIVALIVRSFWNQQHAKARVVITLSISMTMLIGIASWFLDARI